MSKSIQERELIKAYQKQRKNIARQEAELNLNPPQQKSISQKIRGGVNRFSSGAYRFLNKTGVGGAKRINRRSVGVRNLLRQTELSQPKIKRINRPINQLTQSNTNYRDVESYHLLRRKLDLYSANAESRKLSQSTQRILDDLLRIQNKGAIDNLKQQRIQRERKIISASSNMLKTPSLFGPDSNTFKPLERDPQFDILSAKNVFEENPDNNILNTKGRPNILQTKEIDNNLRFF